MGLLGLTLLVANIATPADMPKKALFTPDGQRVICHLTQITGSRLSTRVCRTEAEWDRISRENQAEMGWSKDWHRTN